ncbi:interferon lambda-3 [Mustela erminea]|uniref:interferon lambda-3 n=1 Tax=Mustela erminea TaxID=36723 RepID=UPI001386827C|nr:interferon lambda-3 [Mustela erminea]
MKLDMAVGCLLVLIAMVLTRTEAVPGPKPLGVFPDAGGCHLAQFQSLSPQERQAFKKAKDTFEESLSQKASSCRPRLFPRTWDLQQLQVGERLVALEAEVALTLKVLETMADRSLGSILDQPLHTLRYIQSELQACVEAQPLAGPRPRGRLHHWLHRLHEAPKKEPLGCLETSVMLNLFRLLTRDLKCVASGDLCA